MDISCLATKKLADEGKWFRVDLYDKEWDLWIKVIGADSDVVQNYTKETFKKLARNQKANKKFDDDTIDELMDSDVENAIIRIEEIAGGTDTPDTKDKVILFDREIRNDEDSFRYLFQQIPALVKWVSDKSNERTNFLFSKKKD